MRSLLVPMADLPARSLLAEDETASRSARGQRHRHRQATGAGTAVVAETERGRHKTEDQEDLDSDDDHDEHDLPERLPVRGGHASCRSTEWVVHRGPH
jgi:hypothetical protein